MLPRRGFTLIEMLLVVAVIVLLISFLLPGLSSAHEKSKRTACQGQLHQMGQNVLMYAQTSNGWLPKGKRDNGDEHCIWVATVTHDTLAGLPLSDPASHALWEEPDAMTICPDIPRTFGYYRAPYGWVIGYNYLARHPIASTEGGWKSPNRTSADPSLPIMVDLNNWSPDGWTFVNHTGRGGTVIGGASPHPNSLRTEGGNRLELNGSVRWVDISQMQYRRSGYGDAYPCLW